MAHMVVSLSLSSSGGILGLNLSDLLGYVEALYVLVDMLKYLALSNLNIRKNGRTLFITPNF